MCGITAVITTKKENREVAKQIFKVVLESNEERGTHSSGILAINTEFNTFSLFKKTIPAGQLVRRKKFRKMEADVMLGHTRYATTGAITERNAHPLQRRNTFIVHNGMLSNYADKAKELGIDYQVDSEVLVPIFEKEDWNNLVTVQGSANVISWNEETNRMSIMRHDNPLFVLELEELGITVYSSVRDRLDMLATFYGDDIMTTEFPNDHLITTDMKGNVLDSYRLTFEVKRIAPKVPCNNFRLDDYSNGDYSSSDNEYYEKSLYALNEEEEEKYWADKYRGEFGEDLCELCSSDVSTEELGVSTADYGVCLCEGCYKEVENTAERLLDGKDLVESGELYISDMLEQWGFKF